VSTAPTELVEAVVGSLFVAIGLVSGVVGSSARPRRQLTAVWFAAFCLLYGIRLVANSALIQALTPWPQPLFDYIDVFVSYTILIPAGLFMEALIGPGWHQLIRRTWQVTCACAVVAIVNDIVQRRPGASDPLIDVAVLLTLLIPAAHVLWHARSGRWPIEIRAVAAAGAVVAMVAIYENLAGGGLFGPAFEAEPFTMLLFSGALGWFVLSRARDQAYGFVALSRELEVAREIQQSLLPRDMPNVPGLRIQGAYLPMSAVAGDFYDVVTRPDGRVVVIVADVSGHGVPAALVASMVKVAFATESERYDRPGDILGGINRALTGKFDRAYITACCVSINRAQETMTYAAAGHPPALLRRGDGRIERLDEGGIVLTLFSTATYSDAEVLFHAGDRLLLFTDGLLEAARGDTDEFFGDSELARVVAEVPQSEDISRAVLRAHRAWVGEGTPLSDDVTLVVVECVRVAAT
jgi:sigma-B regulation protein RsbU (phosphoserine phosphatase)